MFPIITAYSFGYGGEGKSTELHVKAAKVTDAMKGPRYSRKVCRPVPRPTEERIPNPTQ